MGKLSEEELQKAFQEVEQACREGKRERKIVDLRCYLTVDSEAGKPFRPCIRSNPETVSHTGVPRSWEKAAGALKRKLREILYEEKLRNGFNGMKVVSEGDSWFLFPVLLEDIIDHLAERSDLAVKSLGTPGDTLWEMMEDREYITAIEKEDPDVFLISGGGNDLLDDIAPVLPPYAECKPISYYMEAGLNERLARVRDGYEELFDELTRRHPKLRIYCYGYDRPTPDRFGVYIGRPMRNRGIMDPILQERIVHAMFDRLNDTMRDLAGKHTNVHYVSCIGAVQGGWFDELHPQSAAFGRIAERFADAMGSTGDSYGIIATTIHAVIGRLVRAISS